MPSPQCSVNAAATTNGVNVAASSVVTIDLDDTGGVSQWSLTCFGTDDGNNKDTITASLAIDQVNKSATLTAPAGACALLFRSKVNNGRDVNNRVDSSLTTTFGVYVLTQAGTRLAADNETTEGDAAHGWTSKFNSLTRSAASGGTGTAIMLVRGWVRQ